ncbi:response regulator [Flavobacterium sp. TMP13]|uniref:response regulator n=1 Tax=unclassified Flavobacterium TaxID=196869 RepID=UPI000833ACB1|nr:response regulator [Flavobacterium sp. TAB 87]
MPTKKNLRIILTDDDEDDRYFFAEATEDFDLNYPIEYCKNGVELISRLNDENCETPDIIFLDLNMPILSGFETLEKIRDNSNFKDIPVIAIYSTSTSEDCIKLTFGLGANAYIVKPDGFDDLKKLLKKVISMDWEEQVKSSEIKSFIIKL